MKKAIDIADDKILVEQLRQGDYAAFNKIYHLYAKDIFARLKRLVHNEQTVEELHQDVFMQLWKNHERLNENVAIRAVLMRTAKSISIDYYRKAIRDQHLRDELLIRASGLYDEVEDYINFKETNQAINAAIDKLPPQRREVFRLIKLENHTYEYAAKYFGVSVSTIKDHMAKAMKTIKEDISLNPVTIYLIVASNLLN